MMLLLYFRYIRWRCIQEPGVEMAPFVARVHASGCFKADRIEETKNHKKQKNTR